MENGAFVGNVVGDFINSGAISASATGAVAQAEAVSQNSLGGTFSGGFTNSGAITATANGTGAGATGVNIAAIAMTGDIINSEYHRRTGDRC